MARHCETATSLPCVISLNGNDSSNSSGDCDVEAFQMHDLQVGNHDMDQKCCANDDDPALLAIQQQVQEMEEWLDTLIQSLLVPPGGRGERVNVTRYNDYDDNDQDGMEEEWFALHYYSEPKLRHDLHMVDLILIPALSLSQPWEEPHDVDQNIYDLQGNWWQSVPMHLHHPLVPVPSTPILPSGKHFTGKQLRHDKVVAHGPVFPSKSTPMRMGTAMANLSFDSHLVTPPATNTRSSGSWKKQCTRPPTMHQGSPLTKQRIVSIQQSNLPQQEGSLLLLAETKQCRNVQGNPRRDTGFQENHPRMQPRDREVNMPPKYLEDSDSLGNATTSAPPTTCSSSTSDEADRFTKSPFHSLAMGADFNNGLQHERAPANHVLISPSYSLGSSARQDPQDCSSTDGSESLSPAAPGIMDSLFPQWKSDSNHKNPSRTLRPKEQRINPRSDTYIPNLSKSHQRKHERDRNIANKIIASSMLPSTNHSLLDKARNNKSNGLPAMTILHSNASNLSAGTRDAQTDDTTSCLWSGIVSPSLSSHQGEGPTIASANIPLVPNASSLSTSPSMSNQSQRSIFLENLNRQLRDIDEYLQANAAAQSSIAAGAAADVSAEEILQDLESHLLVYQDLDTIKTQLLWQAKAETASLGPSSGSRLDASLPEIGLHRHQQVTPPLVIPPSPPSSLHYYSDREPAHKKAQSAKNRGMTPCSWPSTLYPEDGGTVPTAMSTLSLASSEDPHFRASPWQGMVNDMLVCNTFIQDKSAIDIHQNENHDEILKQWNEIGNLLCSNIQDWVDTKEPSTLERLGRKTTTTTTSISENHRFDRRESNQYNTKEDYDTILHALARIYARLYLKPRPAQQGRQDHAPIQPLPKAKGSTSHQATLQDRSEDETVEEAIHRISMRVQIGALQLMEERRSDSNSWQNHIQDHVTKKVTKQLNQMDHNSKDIKEDWLGNLMPSNQWCTGPEPIR